MSKMAANLLTTIRLVSFLGTNLSKSSKDPSKISVPTLTLPRDFLPKCRGGIFTVTVSIIGHHSMPPTPIVSPSSVTSG